MPENPSRADISRRIDKAEKLLQKGKTPDALAEYLLVLKDLDPDNDNVQQLAADLCLSVNKGAMAVQLLGELFDRQVTAADATRASLTYKKLARYTNPIWEQKVRFGQLLERSNKKVAVGTYENALDDLPQAGRQKRRDVAGTAADREPGARRRRIILRLAELSSELKTNMYWRPSRFKAGGSLLQATEQKMRERYYERAYAENPGDEKVAMAYGKNLLAQGDAGAAIFIFEPLVNAGATSPELRDLYAQALLAAERCVEAEPLVWQMFERNPARIHQVLSLIGKMIDCELDSEAVALARKLEAFQRRRGERRSFIATMQEILATTGPYGRRCWNFMAELFNASNRESGLRAGCC